MLNNTNLEDPSVISMADVERVAAVHDCFLLFYSPSQQSNVSASNIQFRNPQIQEITTLL
jgi:hypothetical protein